jgi:hypothetical protein
MKLLLLSSSSRIYRAILQAYPPIYRDRFAHEMGQVFERLCADAYASSGAAGLLWLWLAAVVDSLRALVQQWWQYLVKHEAKVMDTNLINRADGTVPLPARQAWLAVLPFLAFGLSSLANKLDVFHASPAMPLAQVLVSDPFLWFYWLILLGLGASLLAGFPRWGYAYLGWAVLFAWWWSSMRFYGHYLGWLFWLPLPGIMLVALLLRRSLQPLRSLFSGFRRDLTLTSLAIYILYTFMFMLFDENHNPLLSVLIPAMSVAASLGAWGFFRSAAPLRRILALVGGLSLSAAISIIDILTWQNPAFANSPDQNILVLIIFVGLLALLMGLNGLLASWRAKRREIH